MLLLEVNPGCSTDLGTLLSCTHVSLSTFTQSKKLKETLVPISTRR